MGEGVKGYIVYYFKKLIAIKLSNSTIVIIKTIVSLTVLFLLFSKVNLNSVFSIIKEINILCLILSSTMYLLKNYISAIRFSYFVEKVITVKNLFELSMIGGFFNNLLPGNAGGDTVKAYYIYKSTGNAMKTASSIFMDRFIGFVSLIFVGNIAILIGYKEIVGTGLEYFMPLIGVGIFLVTYLIVGLKVGSRFKKISEFYFYFHYYLAKPRILGLIILLSLLMKIPVFLSIYFIAIGFKVYISFYHFIVLIPIILTISSIPITISGFGIRELAFVVLLKIAGVDKGMAIAISFAWFFSYSILSIIGLYYYLNYKKKYTHK